MGKIMMYDEPIAGSVSAAYQAYDNTDSGLAATNVQGAIDEVNGTVNDLDEEKTDNTNLGTVELTTTATAAHAVGTYFILGGQFVKTTVAIGVGDTITVGTNVTATDIGSVLTELNTNKISLAYTDVTVEDSEFESSSDITPYSYHTAISTSSIPGSVISVTSMGGWQNPAFTVIRSDNDTILIYCTIARNVKIRIWYTTE